MALEAENVFGGADDLADCAEGTDHDAANTLSCAHAAGGGAPNNETGVSSKKDDMYKGEHQKCQCGLANRSARQRQRARRFAEVRRDEVQIRKVVAKCHYASPACQEQYEAKRWRILKNPGTLMNRRHYVVGPAAEPAEGVHRRFGSEDASCAALVSAVKSRLAFRPGSWAPAVRMAEPRSWRRSPMTADGR